jgi:hypothetical protein
VETLLKVKDSKRTTVSLKTDGTTLFIQAKSPYAEYKEPSPHLTVDNAREIITAIERFTGTPAIEDTSFVDKMPERGFKIYGHLLDSKGNEIRVQESSACPVVYAWIFCHSPDGIHCEPDLTKDEAQRLAGFLKVFVHDKSWHGHSGECPVCD